MGNSFNASLGMESESELIKNIKNLVINIVTNREEKWVQVSNQWETNNENNKVELKFENKSFFFPKILFVSFTPNELEFVQVLKKKGAEHLHQVIKNNDLLLEDTIVERIREMYKIIEDARQKSNQIEISQLKAVLKMKYVSKYFIDKIKGNQAKIETGLIPNLLKIQTFYEKQIKTYTVIYNNFSDIDFHKSASYQKDHIITTLKQYAEQLAGLETTQNLMIDSYLSGDLVTFFSIYNKFDEMGLLISSGDKTIITNIQDLNNNLDNVVHSIDAVNKNIEIFRESFESY